MGSLLFSVWAGTLAMMVPHVWPYLHANLSNRFTSALLLAALIARCHGYGAGGSRRGVFTHFQLGYALGVSGLLVVLVVTWPCLLYTSPSPRDGLLSRMPSSA